MSFNPAGAMDLSAIVAAAKAPPPPAGAGYVTDITAAELEPLVALSVKHPVVLELHSPRANGAEMSATLAELANEAAGGYLLARVDVDAEPTVAQALGIQAVPAVVAVIAGQLAPLWQGTRSKEDAKAYLDQLLQVAAANGVIGRADPASIDANAGPDPRFAAADEALAMGDFDKAVAEFDLLLNNSPNDLEARAGRAQAALLGRLSRIDPAATLAQAEENTTDVDLQLAAADVEVGTGRAPAAFTRLIAVVAATSGDVRERVRLRLLELFDTVEPGDPEVLKARRALTTALF